MTVRPDEPGEMSIGPSASGSDGLPISPISIFLFTLKLNVLVLTTTGPPAYRAIPVAGPFFQPLHDTLRPVNLVPVNRDLLSAVLAEDLVPLAKL